jgi:hypothetical protein
LPEGPIRTADVFNALPGVYDPDTGMSWTIKTLPVKGSTLAWLFNLLLSPQKLIDGEAPSVSGIQIEYDSPFLMMPQAAMLPFPTKPEDWVRTDATLDSVVKKMKIDGVPIQPSKEYRMAFSGGMHETLVFFNSLLPGIFPMERLEETRLETKQVVRNYLEQMKTLNIENVPYGERMRPSKSDLAILPGSFRIAVSNGADGRYQANVRFKVKNLGLTASAPANAAIQIRGHAGITDPLVDIHPTDLLPPLALPSLAPLAEKDYNVNFSFTPLPGYYPIWVHFERIGTEANVTNNDWVHWLLPADFQRNSPPVPRHR